MPFAVMGTCPPHCGVAMRRTAAADKSAAEAGRVPDSFTVVNFIGYEDHGFADWFGGYQIVEVEVTNVRGAAPVNPSGGLTVKGRAPGATDVAQCAELVPRRRVDVVSRVPAARIAMAHNIGSLTALSAHTILEGPTVNGS
jgi:acetyl-CoA C-acetyltransferase